MKKTIKVIKTNLGYVDHHEYSQGCSTFSTTDDPLKAIDLNNYKFNVDLLMRCFFGWADDKGEYHQRHKISEPTIEIYQVTVERISA